MADYIEIISKIKPKNYQGGNTFPLLDISSVQIDILGSQGSLLYVGSNSRLSKSGISWNNSSNKCSISGDLHINGSLYENSDEKLKKNVITIKDSLQVVSKLNGIQFDWVDNNKHDYGVIAQQLQKIIPQAVSLNSNTGNKQVSYIKMIPFLIQSIKELQLRIKYLQHLNRKENIFLMIKMFIRRLLCK